jgi:polyisoprenoid-binding protein YceI
VALKFKIKMTTQQATQWVFEPAHTKIGFSVRHFGISEVEGIFHKYDGKVSGSNADLSDLNVDLTIDVDSIDTHDQQRDGHLKSGDFFLAEENPQLIFKSTAYQKTEGNKYKVTGDLTMRGVTNTVTLDVVFGGIVEKDPFGNTKAGFKVTGTINRKDWGISWNNILDTGGLAISNEVEINCHVQLLKTA